MIDTWRKLNFTGQQQILVVNSPGSFDAEIGKLEGVRVVRSFGKAKRVKFILAFVTEREEVRRLALKVSKTTEGDAVVWFAYPKQTSNRYACDFHRDSGWEPLGETGCEGVRQVGIDEDWSAIRFRCVEFIKSI